MLARRHLPAPASKGVLVLALADTHSPPGPGLRARRGRSPWTGGGEVDAMRARPARLALSTSRSSRGRAVAVMTWRTSALMPPGPVTATSMDGVPGAVSDMRAGAVRPTVGVPRSAPQPGRSRDGCGRNGGSRACGQVAVASDSRPHDVLPFARRSSAPGPLGR